MLTASSSNAASSNAASSNASSSPTGWSWGQPTKFITSSKNYYQISDNVENKLRQNEVKWGFGGFSKFIFYSKYSRKKSDGSNESWHDVALRCANGSMTIIKNHLLNNHQDFSLPKISDFNTNQTNNFNEKDEFGRMMAERYPTWDHVAEDMASHIISMRMLPPGRGLWGMGELAFKRGGMVLNNCGAATTKDLYVGATWTMGALMYGCGVGFDTEFKGPVFSPNKNDTFTYVIPDTREGWVKSLGLLIRAYVPPLSNSPDNSSPDALGKFPIFDYSKIRPQGSPIKTFGGTASGPGPLRKLHQRVEIFFDTYLAMEDAKLDETLNSDRYLNQKLDIFMKLVDRLTPTDYSDEHKIISQIKRMLEKATQSNNLDDRYYGILGLGENLAKKASDEKYKNKTMFGYGPNLTEGQIYDQISIIILDLAAQIKDKYVAYTKQLVIAQEKINEVHMMMVQTFVNEIKDKIRNNIDKKTYDLVRLTVDIMNSIGACVVAGNVRRSSQLVTGEPDCDTFRLLKDFNVNPERTKIACMSNNSVKFSHTKQYTKYLPQCANQTAMNGEPGYLFLLNVQRYGRVGHIYKPGDRITREREQDIATIPNPCSEIPLTAFELCCLLELAINLFLYKSKLSDSDRLEDLFDFEGFLRACVLGVIYAKSVSILPTSSPLTNKIIRRNHRFGISITGGAQVHDTIGMTHYIKILRAGYDIIRKTDCWLSNILGVRESLRVTTCKPSGTVSLLTGSTSGIHFAHSRYVLRRVRLASTSKLVPFLVKNGYKCEKDLYADNTLVFSFVLDYGPVRSVQNVTMYEQMVLLQMYQREWADNMVSVTVTFDPATEADQLKYALPQFAPTIKSVSFLPNFKGVYPQMPFEEIDKQTYDKLYKPLDFSLLGQLDETSIPRGCTNEHCTM